MDADQLPVMTLTLDYISEYLKMFQQEEYVVAGRTHAAVAMILREMGDDLEILFIERANDVRDPWSGHLAFPGGKVELSEQTRQTAERETLEEIGLDLATACCLGRLSDIVGANLPVRVSCHVFGVDSLAEPAVSAEVQDVFWVRLADLCDAQRHITATVGFSDKLHEVPAIVLPLAGKPVLWGITYRLVMQFLEIIGRV
jgi:8-oxo-dGTP pyrophosphatase MutT (NUDIX family)